MTAPTHIAFGLFSASSLFSLLSASLHKDLPAVGLVTIGSLLPDIDTPGSSLGRLLPFVSVPIERRWGHRTITHGMLCLSGLGALASPLLFTRPAWFAALLIGYGSHLFADSMTKSGVPLFYPSSAICVLPANSRYRFRTGALSEKILFVVMIILLMLVFPISQMGGTWRALRYLMATQNMAYTEFREAKSEAVLEFKGRWRISRKPVAGEAVILDGNKGKLLIAFNGNTWLYGEQGDILPDRSRVRFSKRSVKLDTLFINKEPFPQVRSRIDSGAFVSGRLTADRAFQLPGYQAVPRSQHQTVSVLRTALAFDHATAAEVAHLAPGPLIDEDRVEQVRRQLTLQEGEALSLQMRRPPVHFAQLRETRAALELKRREWEALVDTALTFTGFLLIRHTGRHP